ncbi:hypothetical protein M231_04364 [Tremella mesenterica]|uniref:Zinc finger C2HC5-type domain-containing protein n=1 Tax=Tremella mesenterica TaxID=5217 RepID=A0A4Q1BL18_TREME|nr:hypothetical protein M231_04364 [Tremella mesenterica]
MTQRPPWVARELASILGIDEESVKQMIIPDLEGYTSQARLTSHLQDFLGSSSAAKSFSSRYLALRFPTISNPSLPPPSSTSSLKPSPTPSPLFSQNATKISYPGSPNTQDLINNAFGPGGKIYQKNRDADDSSRHIQPSVPRQKIGGLSIVEKAQKSSQAHENHRDVQGSGSGKGKGKASGKGDKIWDKEKSEVVVKLENVLRNLERMQLGQGALEEEGHLDCFCQAQIHPLSQYTPHCGKCGLIICSLHPSHLPCPSCRRSLLSPAQLSRLIVLVQGQLSQQLSIEESEEEERERIQREQLLVQSGGGSFPSLSSSITTSIPTPTSNSTPEGRKVLNLSKGKGKATLTTYTMVPTLQNGTNTLNGGKEGKKEIKEREIREDIVGKPKEGPDIKGEKDLIKVLRWREEEDRPWGDMKGIKKEDVWEYVGKGNVVEILEEGMVGRRKSKKLKGIGMDGKLVVGAAT